MKKLATEFGIKIIWFYGDPGHGGGKFLTRYFSTDNSKEYCLVYAAETAKVKRGELEFYGHTGNSMSLL